jgi:hypothetical protein
VPARHRLLKLMVPEHAAILRAPVALRREDRAELAAAKRASGHYRISAQRRRDAERGREVGAVIENEIASGEIESQRRGAETQRVASPNGSRAASGILPQPRGKRNQPYRSRISSMVLGG